MTEIADNAFQDWENLAEVVFVKGNKLEKIGARAFAGTALERFVAPRQLKVMQANAFVGCKKLRELILNEGLERIEGECDGVF